MTVNGGQVADGPAPARVILRRAEADRRRLGHENQGFLSERYGFMPVDEPLRTMPGEYAVWDEVAARVPMLHAGGRLRGELAGLPVLDAGPTSLPDRWLLRAALVLGHTAHWARRQDEPLPAPLERPWSQVRARLGREAPTVSLLDVLYNWRLVDPAQPRRRVENLRLLVPAVDPPEEHLTAVEIVAESGPMVAAMVRAQEAVLVDDATGLEFELMVVLDGLRRLRVPLTRLDPVGWARLGTPTSSALDVFLGRGRYRPGPDPATSTLPAGWRDFFRALGAVSVPAYVANRGRRSLVELLLQVTEAYTTGGRRRTV